MESLRSEEQGKTKRERIKSSWAVKFSLRTLKQDLLLNQICKKPAPLALSLSPHWKLLKRFLRFALSLVTVGLDGWKRKNIVNGYADIQNASRRRLSNACYSCEESHNSLLNKPEVGIAREDFFARHEDVKWKLESDTKTLLWGFHHDIADLNELVVAFLPFSPLASVLLPAVGWGRTVYESFKVTDMCEVVS